MLKIRKQLAFYFEKIHALILKALNGWCCHGYLEVEGVDLGMSAARIGGAVELDLCQIQKPLPIGHLLRPIKLHLQVPEGTQGLPVSVHLRETAWLHLSCFLSGTVQVVWTDLQSEDHRTADVLRLLHGLLADHTTAEEDGVRWADPAGNSRSELSLDH